MHRKNLMHYAPAPVNAQMVSLLFLGKEGGAWHGTSPVLPHMLLLISLLLPLHRVLLPYLLSSENVTSIVIYLLLLTSALLLSKLQVFGVGNDSSSCMPWEREYRH